MCKWNSKIQHKINVFDPLSNRHKKFKCVDCIGNSTQHRCVRPSLNSTQETQMRRLYGKIQHEIDMSGPLWNRNIKFKCVECTINSAWNHRCKFWGVSRHLLRRSSAASCSPKIQHEIELSDEFPTTSTATQTCQLHRKIQHWVNHNLGNAGTPTRIHISLLGTWDGTEMVKGGRPAMQSIRNSHHFRTPSALNPHSDIGPQAPRRTHIGSRTEAKQVSQWPAAACRQKISTVIRLA